MRGVLLLLVALSALPAAEPAATRVLFDFEDPAELEELRRGAEGVALDLVQDNGVTHGRTCARLVLAQGDGAAVLTLGGARIRDWSKYAAIAFDVFQERADKQELHVELWDQASHDYHTRCTYDRVVRQGRNTIVVAIDRAKRNGKEGRAWAELEPQDRIDLDGLKLVKLFAARPQQGGDVVWWIDHVRLLTSDAVAGPQLAVVLPAGAKAFACGRAVADVAGFAPVAAEQAFTPAVGCGVLAGKAQAMGNGWPDALSGRGLIAPDGGTLQLALALADGEYDVWLAGGMAIDGEAGGKLVELKLGDALLYQDRPSAADLQGERYLQRFLATRYSQRPHALWLDFIERMYPAWQRRVRVAGGRLVVGATRFWLSALVAVPAGDPEAFAALVEQLRAQRMQAFERTLTLDARPAPPRQPGDGAALAFIPDVQTAFHPGTVANARERARRAYDLAAAPGERVILRLGVTAFEELGECRCALTDLAGPRAIPASAARLFVVDYRVRGDGVAESALLPQATFSGERGITWGCIAWLQVPEDAPPGTYQGAMTVTPATGPALRLPLTLTVQPFRLRADLPLSLGMYYNPPADERAHREQLRFMREIGFTATELPAGRIDGVQGERVRASFDEAPYRRAREAGFGRDPGQLQMTKSLGAARRIAAAHLGLGARVDQRPGCEQDDPRLKPLWQDYLRQYAAFAKGAGLPMAVEIVDEPREVPNPWNRTLEQTNRYADWMREAGLATGFVTPMGDRNDGKDYTSLVEHAAIISTHAGRGSERLMRLTAAAGKPLWIYNTGMDRLSWGFWLARSGAVGRWEWHFRWSEGGATGGYPNEGEWHNPFTANDAFAPMAPPDRPGAMLFKTAFLDVADGITDLAYVVTLRDALARAGDAPARQAAVAQARALLAELERDIPFLPEIHGLAGADSGALVGQGLRTPVAERCAGWRRRCAESIGALRR
jgi:hypothetical protein